VAVSVATAMLLGAVFAGDSVWMAIAVLAVAGGWSALALAGRVPLPGGGTVLLGLVLAIAAWSGLSVAWSVAPDLSWAEVNRTLVLAAFLAVGLLLGAGGQAACRWAAAALVTALGAAVLWALAGKVIPGLFADGGRAARLRDPIGYWNALALAADMLLVLALRLAAAPSSRMIVRLGGAALAYSAVVAVFLTASRAGVAAAVLGVGLWLWLRRDRVEGALLTVAASIPAAGVAAWAFTRPALVEDGQPRADRVADGAWFGIILVAGAALVALIAFELARRPLGPSARRTAGRVLAGLAIAAALVGGVALVANAGRVADEFRGGEVSNDPTRFLNASSNNRLAWWREARSIFEGQPVTGAGANTFEVARKRYRENASAVSQPHSVPLQFLAGTGLVGLALFLALVAAAGVAAIGALRRLDGIERDAAAALAVALALWLVHALVDYDWDFVAVTGTALFAAGVLAAAGLPARRAPGLLAAAGAAALAVAAIVSVATPWLAERELRQVNVALDRGDLDAAVTAVERARSLDALSLEPVFAAARVAEQRRREVAALEAYREATRLQPKNPESWLQLGLYEFDIGDRCAAYRHLNEAYTLDPAGKQWTPGGPLVVSLAWVNAGNCG
jgi:tetratricopeptide (TPR) repeat protein